MKLTDRGLRDSASWQAAGIALPGYDRAAMSEATRKAPIWLHFGAGNLFRAFPAMCQQKLLNDQMARCGVTVADSAGMVDKVLQPHDNLSVVVRLCPDGRMEKEVLGSIGESLRLLEDAPRLQDVFCQKSLQMVSFTITEKGYRLTDGQGRYADDVEHDLMAGPDFCVSYMGRVAAMLYRRYLAGAYPLAMVSMDNCSHNGDHLLNAMLTMARSWEESGVCQKGFADYVSDPSRVAFPWTMIDKITPRPDAAVQEKLLECGLEDMGGYVTRRGSYAAPFVNAEETQYLVVEDAFPNGRPPLECAGVLFTNRETVEKVERMKVCTCLNPLHTALAVFGCLLGYHKICDEMQDADLAALVKRIGYQEGLPVVTDPGVLSPKEFLDDVIEKRLPNPFLPDTPQRIACDTSQKIPVRFGETIKAYLKRPEADLQSLKMIPLVFAAWCRYLMGVDDRGQPFEVSPDPMAAQLQGYLADAHLGDPRRRETLLKPILSNAELFGVDLYASGLAHKVEEDFFAMLEGPGAVRGLLRRRLAE